MMEITLQGDGSGTWRCDQCNTSGIDVPGVQYGENPSNHKCPPISRSEMRQIVREEVTAAIDSQRVAEHLNALPRLERQSFIEELQEATVFCWDCFSTSDGKGCHCKNDE